MYKTFNHTFRPERVLAACFLLVLVPLVGAYGQNPYEGCCGVPPVQQSFGGAKIYIPNVFTPNNDGVNDLFLPLVTEDIIAVTEFTISTPENDVLLYSTEKLEIAGSVYGWNGLTREGKPHRGLFKFSMALHTKSGEKLTLEGLACAVLCDKESLELKGNPACLYPDQTGMPGVSDSAVPSFENKHCYSN